ncbi:hypothetical protein INH39_08345 [Massilia violaceinigra]|uniref:Chemotaxis protein n=1 Tax=Massilia violaceinigra TaxID=2045208 RepID=A0ABY4AAQ4_9BURK|nr:hypothetical protein [Massilia violaceinigra]UOD31677.1 hypothetical protein INH39_08345 [Massilia violaceinigra]
MSAFATLAGGSVWKLASAVLLAALLVTVSAGATAWWLAASARDQAQAELRAQQTLVTRLRGALDAQNAAVAAAGLATTLAEQRGEAARQQAAASARRFDLALARVAGVKATTCAEAMPAVNLILESIR